MENVGEYCSIGGFETSWEDYITFPSGLKIATIHGGLFDLKLENIKIGQY
jgi:hypothetical protein